MGLRILVGEPADKGLAYGGRKLKNGRDQPDLRKGKPQSVLEKRQRGKDQRLKGVIEKMRNAQCPKDKVFRLRCGSDGSTMGQAWRPFDSTLFVKSHKGKTRTGQPEPGQPEPGQPEPGRSQKAASVSGSKQNQRSTRSETSPLSVADEKGMYPWIGHCERFSLAK